jgi:hypothetical protein
MRQIRFLVIFLVCINLPVARLWAESKPKAVIEWKEMTFDFGEIPFEKPIQADFTFTNPGMIPLIISDVRTSCGCTVADYPKKPVGSGSSGTITVTFDAKSPGYFAKTITVFSNTEEGMTQLYIKGVVVKER